MTAGSPRTGCLRSAARARRAWLAARAWASRSSLAVQVGDPGLR